MSNMHENHAFLSASSAYRWLRCTPSARLHEAAIKKYPERGIPSSFADEGTIAHRWAYEIIQNKFQFPAALKLQYYLEPVIDKEAVMMYVDFVKGLNERCEWPAQIEVQVDMGQWVPNGFGTVDFFSFDIHNKRLHVVDFKYGKGVREKAIKKFAPNPQLVLYAGGVFDKYGWMEEALEQVELHIFQPRMRHHSSTVVKRKALDTLLRGYKDRAILAYDGKGYKRKGDHCRFCASKPECFNGELLITNILQK